MRLRGGAEGEVGVAAGGKRVGDLRVEKQGNTVSITTERSGMLGIASSLDVVVAGPPGMGLEAKLGSANLTAEVPLVACFGVIFLGEPLDWRLLDGALFIFGSGVGLNLIPALSGQDN